MRKIVRVSVALVTVCLLTAYFFADLDISGRVEMMTWEEFSANPVAMAHFKDRAALTDPSIQSSDLETRRAYDRYVAANTSGATGISGLQTAAGDRMDAFRNAWQSVYRVWPTVPKRSSRPSRRPKISFSPEASNRIGIALTFGALVVAVSSLTFAIKVVEEKARV